MAFDHVKNVTYLLCLGEETTLEEREAKAWFASVEQALRDYSTESKTLPDAGSTDLPQSPVHFVLQRPYEQYKGTPFYDCT